MALGATRPYAHAVSDPLSLLPFALAAAGGAIDGVAATALVAAGVTLLQRSAALVRAFGAAPSAILLPPGPMWLTALAASDGRPALLLSPLERPDELRQTFARSGAKVVFTTSSLRSCVPVEAAVVLLDDAPVSARVHIPGREQHVDLGAHLGLELMGDPQVDGRDECALMTLDAHGVVVLHSHRDVLRDARAAAGPTDVAPSPASEWSDYAAFIARCAGPLLRGQTIATAVR